MLASTTTMEPRSESSPSSFLTVQKVLLLLIGTTTMQTHTNAYVTSPALSLSLRRSRNTAVRLYSNSNDDEAAATTTTKAASSLFAESDSDSNGDAPTTIANFGDVMPISRKSSSSTSASSAQFGDVVSIPKKQSPSSPLLEKIATSSGASSATATVSDAELLRQRRTRNIGVAILSIFLAVGNYAYEWTHPVTPIQLLVNMERSSAPLADIGKNSKPTVIDFWAPWCENCRSMAPTLFQVEESYKDKVNFVLVNGDDPNNWPLIEALGVDAIPHLAMVESDGTVDTALIGAVPKEWLSRDIDVLLDNANAKTKTCDTTQVVAKAEAAEEAAAASSGENCGKEALPYQMLDVFANRQDQRKLANLDTIFEAGKR